MDRVCEDFGRGGEDLGGGKEAGGGVSAQEVDGDCGVCGAGGGGGETER